MLVTPLKPVTLICCTFAWDPEIEKPLPSSTIPPAPVPALMMTWKSSPSPASRKTRPLPASTVTDPPETDKLV